MNHPTFSDSELRGFVQRRALTPDGDLLERILRETESMPQTPVRFALLTPVAAVALAAVLLVGAMLIFRPPSPDPGVSPSPTALACADRPPEFDGEAIHPVVVADGTGLVAACRLIGPGEAQVAGALSTVRAVNPNGVDTRLQVFWVEANCDQAARVEVTRDTDAYVVAVLQQRDGPCMGGSGLQAIELELSAPLPASAVQSTIIYGTRTACAPRDAASANTPNVTVSDGTGLVRSCRVIGPPASGLSLPAAVNRGGVETRLEVYWALNGCDTGDATVDVARDTGAHAITIVQERGLTCAGSGTQGIELQLSGPLPSSTTKITLVRR